MTRPPQPGSFLILGIPGEEDLAPVCRFIRAHDLLGVVLFARNFRNAQNLRTQIQYLQESKKAVSDDPLLVATDYEGGFVTRFTPHVPWIPSAYAQGFLNQKQATVDFYHAAGHTLRHLGINVALAPVLDVLPGQGFSPMAPRCFSRDPQKVSELARSAMDGLAQGGVLACGKHFPGLGAALLDTHRMQPMIRKETEHFRREDLEPFRSLIACGLPLLMTSHAVYPDWCPENHVATFCPELLKDTLRDRLGFQGLLLSDDLGMGAVREKDSPESAVCKALEAGVDAALVCHEWERSDILVAAVDRYLAQHPQPDALQEQHRTRREAVFRRLRELDPVSPPAILELCRKAARAALTPLKIAPRSLNPGPTGTTWILAPRFWTSAEVEAANTWTEAFIARLQTAFGPARWVPLEDDEAVERFRSTPLAPGTRSLWITGGEAVIRDRFTETHSGNNAPILFDLGVLVKQPEAPMLEPYCRTMVSTSGFHETHQEALIEWIHQVLGWR